MSELVEMLQAAGFADVLVVPKPQSKEYIKVIIFHCSIHGAACRLIGGIASYIWQDWLPGSKAEDHVVSADVTARKP